MINGISFTFASVKNQRRERKRSLLLLIKCSEEVDFARKRQSLKIRKGDEHRKPGKDY
jgi:hypothetical protein